MQVTFPLLSEGNSVCVIRPEGQCPMLWRVQILGTVTFKRGAEGGQIHYLLVLQPL